MALRVHSALLIQYMLVWFRSFCDKITMPNRQNNSTSYYCSHVPSIIAHHSIMAIQKGCVVASTHLLRRSCLNYLDMIIGQMHHPNSLPVVHVYCLQLPSV